MSTDSVTRFVYKIVAKQEWPTQGDSYNGSAFDNKDGFIHLSNAKQAKQVCNLFFQNVHDLLLVQIDSELLQAQLKWEAPVPDNGSNDLFPHLYGKLNFSAVTHVYDLPWDENAKQHAFAANLK